jgi:hypothetical protein
MPKTHAARDKMTDFDKLLKERNAAQFLRDDICFIVGTCRAANPDIAEKLEEALAAHQKIRCQDWM